MSHSPVLSALAGRCPVCDEGRAFKGPIKMRAQCGLCGAKFDRDEGFWTGAITLPYIFASFWVVGALAFVWASGEIMNPKLTWMLPLSTVVLVGLIYPISKRLWLGLYGEWGYLYPDPMESSEPAPATDRSAN